MKLFPRQPLPKTAQVTVIFSDGERANYSNLGEALEVAIRWRKLHQIERSLIRAFPAFECLSTS